MLKNPFLNEEFLPDLMWFIGQFDVYDREETRGVALGGYDPNDKHDRSVLIVRYALDLACLSYRHKHVLVAFLEKALKDPNYNFQALFEIDEDCAGSWPRDEWYNLDNPRGFLQDVFVLAKEVWGADLKKAAQEALSTC